MALWKRLNVFILYNACTVCNAYTIVYFYAHSCSAMCMSLRIPWSRTETIPILFPQQQTESGNFINYRTAVCINVMATSRYRLAPAPGWSVNIIKDTRDIDILMTRSPRLIGNLYVSMQNTSCLHIWHACMLGYYYCMWYQLWGTILFEILDCML